MKKLISVILAVCLMFSCVCAAPFVQMYDEIKEQSKTTKVIADGNYVYGLSENGEIYVYDISDKNNVECINTIYRDGFMVKDMDITQSKLTITYDSATESHVTQIRITDVPKWNKDSVFSDFASVTAAECEIESSTKFTYFKSRAENKVYVCEWTRGVMRYKGELGEEYVNMQTSGKYMYLPDSNGTKVYDVSSAYAGTEKTTLPFGGITKAVESGDYIIIATANEVKVFASDLTEIYSYDAQNNIADIELGEENLWVYTGEEIQLLDASDIATGLELKSKAAGQGQQDIATNGECAFVSSESGIKAYRNLPYEITDAAYSSSEGEIIYSANFGNYTNDDISAEIYMLALKDGQTVNVTKETLTLAANSQTPVEITLAVADDCEIRTLIVDNLTDLNILSTEYENNKIVSYMETNKETQQNIAYEGEESLAISEADEYGTVTVCGVSVAEADRAVTIAVTYGGDVAFLESVIAAGNTYGFAINPASYGTHNVTVNDCGQIYSGSFEVALPELKVGTHIEDMGRNTYIIMNVQNMQNAEAVQLEMAYDAAALEFETEPQILDIMEGFEVESISAESGVLTASLIKTGDVKTTEAEFLKIAVKTSETAPEGTYTLAPSMQTTDVLGNTASAKVTPGSVEIHEVVEKYDAIDAATEVLKTVKADFDKAEYRTQKVIVADSNAKIEAALSKGAREYDFDSTLMQNLKSAENVLAKYEPEFNAIDAINAVAAADIDAEIGKYVKLLNIKTALWDIYTASEIDKTDIRTKLEACVFNLPANINSELAEIIIPGLIEKIQWSAMDEIITELGKDLGFGDSRYASLSTDAKKNVGRAIAGKTFADIAEVKAALKTAVDTYYNTPSSGVISGKNNGGGQVSSNVSFTTVVPSALPDSLIPESYKDTLVFEDLGEAEWAREAIEYLAKKEIINGTGGNCFTPSGNVTREAFVKMLVGALEITSDVESEFTDVDKNAWYYTYINTAAGKGIVSGYDDGSFGVGKNITREEMTVIIKRAIDFCGIVLEDKNDRIIFDDGEEISIWAKESITAMQKAGIINGVSNTTFVPHANATRAQAAKLIYEIARIKAEQGV